MRALRATAEAMRAWPTEIVERECVSVTPSVRASKLVGRRGQDGRRCFTEKCPTKLVLVPQLRHHQAVVGAGLKRDGTCRSGVQCPTSWDRSGRTGRDTLFYRAFPGKSRHRPARLSSPTRTVKTCPLGVMDPRREGKGSPPVVGIRFHIGGKRIPGSLRVLCPARPLGGMGHGTGTGRRWPIACGRSRRAHPRRRARWDKWTRRDNKKWSRRDGTLTFNIRGAPESGPTARWGVGLR